MDIYLVKQLNNTLKAANDSDLEKLNKIKMNEMVKCVMTKPRNIKFHRKFFSLINMVFQNQEVYSDIDNLREELTKACGYFDSYINHKGITVYKAKSISFSKMDNTEFEELYNKFLDVIVLIFKWDKSDIIDNINEYA
jgi:hypothetical protein